MHTMLLCLFSLIASTAVADDLLWGKLQHDPDMVVLMRNAESSGNKNGNNMLVWDATGNCKGESTLTSKGRAHAKMIGEAFARRGIKPIVISSPMCRCTETARIAFGDFLTDPDLRQAGSMDSQQQELFQTRAAKLLGKYRGENPVVFVNHRPNIDSLTMELLEIGDLLVGSINETGEVDVLGRIKVIPD